ncbi:MAG: hypothetical protein CMO55_00980 [Verrucomicrobiales bacterium]|nr:hypothetical protein [Verrucomicrobiales bacterium]
MFPNTPIPFKPFLPSQTVGTYRTDLPHWRQPGVTYFVTFRLADSIPAEVLESWGKEKIEWLTEKGVKAKSPISPENVPTELRYLFDRTFNRKLNAYLDGFHGSCILRKPVARPPLLKALESVDSLIGDLVIMPNHVHILITPAENETLQKALKRIKGASARGINLALGQNGKVWKKHSYDHIVRDLKQLNHYKDYIASNPVRARIRDEAYTWKEANYTIAA